MRVAMLRGKIQYGEAPVLGGHRLAINRCTRHTPPNDEPLVLEPLARNLEGPSSHLKRKMSNILPSRPLVGRAHELEVLGKALAAAQDGTGAAVFLKGDTGTGKSRLAWPRLLSKKGTASASTPSAVRRIAWTAVFPTDSGPTPFSRGCGTWTTPRYRC